MDRWGLVPVSYYYVYPMWMLTLEREELSSVQDPDILPCAASHVVCVTSLSSQVDGVVVVHQCFRNPLNPLHGGLALPEHCQPSLPVSTSHEKTSMSISILVKHLGLYYHPQKQRFHFQNEEQNHFKFCFIASSRPVNSFVFLSKSFFIITTFTCNFPRRYSAQLLERKLDIFRLKATFSCSQVTQNKNLAVKLCDQWISWKISDIYMYTSFFNTPVYYIFFLYGEHLINK